jgi:hypothetical protein
MLLPYLKRVVESCHKRGLSFEMHCCGKTEDLVPLFIEAGADLWCGQNINDYDRLAHQYKDSCLTFGIQVPGFDEAMTREQIREHARRFVERFRGCRVALSYDDPPGKSIFELLNQDWIDAVYEFSREEYRN